MGDVVEAKSIHDGWEFGGVYSDIHRSTRGAWKRLIMCQPKLWNPFSYGIKSCLFMAIDGSMEAFGMWSRTSIGSGRAYALSQHHL
jgi:hypothetical protein